jgi:hypothetical protein
MNKHILLVKKWLADKDSVSHEELRVNSNAAAYAADVARAGDYAAYVYAAAYTSYAAYAAYSAYDADYAGAGAAHWVKRYEELTK